MKRGALVYSLVLVILWFMCISVASAECPRGKEGATIYTPGGKVIEICVAAKAIKHIGGPNDIVVPDICPCWSPNDLESYAEEWEPTYPLVVYQCFDNASGATFVNTFHPQGYLDMNTFAKINYEYSPPYAECKVHIQLLGVSRHETGIDDNQYRACLVSLLKSDLWEMYCGGGN